MSVFIRFLITSLFLLAIDAYAFKGIVLLSRSINDIPKYIIYSVYWVVSIVMIVQLINIFTNFDHFRTVKPEAFVWWSGVFFTIFISKLVFIFFHFTDDIVHAVRWMVNGINDNAKSEEFQGAKMNRATFLTQIGAGVGVLFLGLYSYGMTRGKYAFRVIREKIQFDNLPKSFAGTKIVHISDMHLGSFANQIDKVAGVVDTINDLDPDYIFFTGDMVNTHCSEAEPWIPVFNKLKAKKGRYSIFGNHDYADYGNFTPEEKNASISRLKEIHKEMGFQLLEDEFVEVDNGEDKISIIGMHNWGKGFHQVGNLDHAMNGIDENQFKLLLSHDPTLWEEKVMNKRKIDLTFSGHTHGMQMGLELPSLGIKFSPVSLRYKRWAGLYQSDKNDQKIYINRGFGVLGFPGRVGMPPEITLIELGTKA